MLKEWRAEKAASGLALYMIISNKAIEELAKYKPQSKAEMFSINGLGESKIGKYGDELLKIICG
jgi:ATP-dependent DNA helicase RecQ